MAPSLPRTTSHVRSSSWPSTSHFLHLSIEDRLHKLNALDQAKSLSSTSFLCQNLSNIKELYEDINNLIQCTFNQQILSLEQHRDGVEAVLEGSLGLLDACGSTIDVMASMKESILVLESALRRKNGVEENDINAYLMTRKKLNKVGSKIIKRLPKVNLNKNGNFIPVVRMLRQAETLSLTLSKHVLAYLCQPKGIGKGSSLMAKLMHPKKGDANEIEKVDQVLLTLEAKNSSIDTKMPHDLLKQLATLELAVQEIEECLESISRCLLKTRVSLLNVLSQ